MMDAELEFITTALKAFQNYTKSGSFVYTFLYPLHCTRHIILWPSHRVNDSSPPIFRTSLYTKSQVNLKMGFPCKVRYSEEKEVILWQILLTHLTFMVSPKIALLFICVIKAKKRNWKETYFHIKIWYSRFLGRFWGAGCSPMPQIFLLLSEGTQDL